MHFLVIEVESLMDDDMTDDEFLNKLIDSIDPSFRDTLSIQLVESDDDDDDYYGNYGDEEEEDDDLELEY